MKVKSLSVFKSKLFYPCRKLQLLCSFRLKKPLFIKALRFRKSKKNPSTKKRRILFLPTVFRSSKKNPSAKKRRILFLPTVFRSSKKSKRKKRIKELNKSYTAAESNRGHFSSPVTPAYAKILKGSKRETRVCDDDVEDACRSFENYLSEMIVEEGKVGDLTDLEELLYCWKNLESPVFIDLVSRFYGELCKDLFSIDNDVESLK